MYKCTLSVTRQVRYFLSSPTTITLLRNGISFLISFSMGSGWIFTPPDRVITAEVQKRGKEGKMKKKARRRGSEGKWKESVVSLVVSVFERIIFNTQTSATTNTELYIKGMM